MEGVPQEEKKMKVLCLHGFRTSGGFLRKQISKWHPSIFQDFDMVFPDGVFPAGGKSEIEGIFPPPYYEWFQFNKEFTEYINLDKGVTQSGLYIPNTARSNGGALTAARSSRFMFGNRAPHNPSPAGLLKSGLERTLTPNGPMGATLCALLIGYQAQGKVLKDHPPIKFMVSISGSKFRDPSICDIAYGDIIKVKSVHLIGERDWLKLPSEELATAFESPLIIRHPQGHTVPRLDEAAVEQLSQWTWSILHGSKFDAVDEEKNEMDCSSDDKEARAMTISHGLFTGVVDPLRN